PAGGIPGVELDAVVLGPPPQRGVAGDQAVVGARVPEHRVAACWEDPRPDAIGPGHRRADRCRQLDPQLPGHVDDQVADERRAADPDALAGQPAEQLREPAVHGLGQAVHGDGHRDSRVVLRGAFLDLRLAGHLVASVSCGTHTTAGCPVTHRWPHPAARDVPRVALPRRQARPTPPGQAARAAGQAGRMLALRWNRLPGSYSALIRASRSYLAGP